MKTPTEKVDSLATYIAIYVALMLLLILTVLAAEQNLGEFNTAISLVIAVIKALLVILFFMHVRHSSKLVWVFAGAAFVWLLLMLGLTMTDYLGRPADTPQQLASHAAIHLER